MEPGESPKAGRADSSPAAPQPGGLGEQPQGSFQLVSAPALLQSLISLSCPLPEGTS